MLVMLLDRREATVLELAAPFAMSQPAVTKHLKVLEAAGLVSRLRRAQKRPAVLNGEALKKVLTWLESYRRIWERNFRQLDQVLGELEENSEEAP